MDTKKCKHCQEDINKKAKKCPKCQGDLRNWFSRHPILTGILVLIVIGIFGTAASGEDDNASTSTPSAEVAKAETTPETTNQETTEEPTEPNEPPLEVSADEIGDDFDSNQVAAEQKWDGKLVKFSAEIGNITDSGIAFQNVGSKEFSLTQISCRVDDKNQLLNIKNGQVVTVQGIIGKQTLGVITMNDCEIVE